MRMKSYHKNNLSIIGKIMGPLAQFLLALTNLVRSGSIRNVSTAIKAAEREFGKLTPLLKKQIERIFEQAKNVESGRFEAGINILGLSEGMVGYATEDGMVTSEMAAAADAAAADIASGALVVADWSQE